MLRRRHCCCCCCRCPRYHAVLRWRRASTAAAPTAAPCSRRAPPRSIAVCPPALAPLLPRELEVVRRTLRLVTEHGERRAKTLEGLLGVPGVISVRVDLEGKLLVRSLDLLRARIARECHYTIVIQARGQYPRNGLRGTAAGPKALEVPSVCSALLSIAQLDALIGEVQCIIVVSTIRRAFCLQE